MDLDALEDDFSGSGLDENLNSSTNRSFNSASSVVDVPEDLMLELEDEPGLRDDHTDAVDSSVDALTSSRSASFEELDEDLSNHSDSSKVGLDPLVFSSGPLDETLEKANNFRPSSIRGTQSTLELGDTPEDFDIDKVAAMNDASDNTMADAPDELSSELSSELSDELSNELSDSALNEPAVQQTPLPSLDPEISSLAAKASQRLRDNENSTADRPILDQTMANDPIADATSTDDELDFLDSTIDDNRETIIDQQREVLHQKDALTEDLERQADTWLPSGAEPVAALQDHSLPGTAVAAGAAGAAGTAMAAGAGAIEEILPTTPSLERAELLSGPGRVYRVFSRGPNDTKAVKKGLSWAAMFFTFLWLFVKRMPGTAIVYALLWVALIGGFIVSGIVWLDTPAPVAPLVAFWPLAFAALAVIGLILIPLVMANRWHANSLQGRGYEEIASVRATSPSSAVDRIVQLEA